MLLSRQVAPGALDRLELEVRGRPDEPGFIPIHLSMPIDASQNDPPVVHVEVPIGQARHFQLLVFEVADSHTPRWRGCTLADISATETTVNLPLFAIEAENQPPTMRPASDQVHAEGERAALQLLASDPDCGILQYDALTLPPDLRLDRATGRISGMIAATAAVNGPYLARVEVTDGTERTGIPFLWTVMDRPVVTIDDEVTTAEGAGVTIAVLGNDVGDNDAVLTVTSVTSGANGTVVIAGNGTVQYTPNADFFGTDSFTYTVSNNRGETDSAMVTVAVAAVNNAPSFTASNPLLVLTDSGPVTVAGWATFAPGAANEADQTATYAVSNVSLPALFAVPPAIASDGTLTYTPAPAAFGTATFDVQVHDSGGRANGGQDTSAVQTFTITVNAPPVARDDAGITNVNTPITFVVLVNDSDPDGSLAPTSLTMGIPPTNGSALLNPDDTITYTPTPGFVGLDTFTYTVADNRGALSNQATVTVTVNAALLSITENDPCLRQIDPATGTTLASVTITLDGEQVVGGRSLATHPVTGELWALLSRFQQRSFELATIHPATGAAVSIGSVIEDLVTTGVVRPSAIALDVANGQMYWTQNGTIQRANLNGTAVETLVEISPSRRIDGIALDVANGQMYWTTTLEPPILPPGPPNISRANLDGTSIEILTEVALGPGGIALDVANGQMYWTDRGLRAIRRANLDGTAVEDLITELDNPSRITLDMAASKMYWTDSGARKIQRADLDGTTIEDLIVTGLDSPLGIALDVANGQMYWTDFRARKIQRANLDGTTIEDLTATGPLGPIGIALDVANDALYWTEVSEQGGIGRVRRTTLGGTAVTSLAFDPTGTLFALTNADALVRLDTAVATQTVACMFAAEAGGVNGSLALNPIDARLYRLVRSSPPIFERVESTAETTCTTTNIALRGLPFDPQIGLTYWESEGIFLSTARSVEEQDLPPIVLSRLTSDGLETPIGELDHDTSGLAFNALPPRNDRCHELPTISVRPQILSVNEDADEAMFTVELAPASLQTVTVDFATADGNAVASEDYAASSGTLTFLPGETNKEISVTIISDNLAETRESFVVTLTNPTNARFGGREERQAEAVINAPVVD
jgi:sugar lactone lactonase YvrE